VQERHRRCRRPAPPICRPGGWLLRRSCRFRSRLERARVHRPDEGDDPPEVIAGLDDTAEDRHRSGHDFMLHAAIASFCQPVGTKRYQAEKRVVIGAVDALPVFSASSAGPGSRAVPTARPVLSGFMTVVATRTNSSPSLTKSVAAAPFPPALTTSSTTATLLFILINPKYKAGASLPPTASLPSIFGAPSLAVWSSEQPLILSLVRLAHCSPGHGCCEETKARDQPAA